jgi:hypothetical protein
MIYKMDTYTAVGNRHKQGARKKAGMFSFIEGFGRIKKGLARNSACQPQGG